MKFTAELVFAAHSPPGVLGPAPLTALARAAEAAGFDAMGFNEHPVPSRKWLAAGGHDAFDPVAALSYCAAVTERIRLLPYLVVLPLHNPFLLAKSLATLDVLSGGRLVVGVATGYLRSEFAAAGVPFEERNERFDQAVAAMIEIWSGEAVVGEALAFQALDQVATPLPPQRPHPPIWVGGNTRVARRRVARWGTGWAPLQNDLVGARTTRTSPIPTVEAMGAAIAELHAMVAEEGRDPAGIEVQVQSAASRAVNDDGFHAASHLDELGRLADVGVTQFVVHMIADGRVPVADKLQRYREEVLTHLP